MQKAFVSLDFLLSYGSVLLLNRYTDQISNFFLFSFLLSVKKLRIHCLFWVPDRKFLTGQRQITRRVAFCFGQAAALAAAVLQDVSSSVHPVLWITQDRNNVKHITDRLFTESQKRELTVVWGKILGHVFVRCGLKEKGE